MSIYKTPYETTIGSGLVTHSIEHSIKEAFIKDMLQDNNLDVITSLEFKPVFITGYRSSESNIPFFAHPLAIENYKGLDFICSDIRPFIKQADYDVNNIQFRNQTEFNLAKHRLILNLAWLSGASEQIHSTLDLPAEVFAGWLSDVLAKNFALDPKDQLTIFVATLYYYHSLFSSQSFLSDDNLQSIAFHTIKVSKATSQFVTDVFSQITETIKKLHIKQFGIQEYCLVIRTVVENVRLDKLNAGILITLTGNSWYGLNGKEILAVSLEHPPSWCAMVYAALTQKTYKHSLIAKVGERFTKGTRLKDFTLAFETLIENYIETKDDNGIAHMGYPL